MFQHLPGGDETSVGRDAVELAALAGLVLDDWQSWFLRESMRQTAGRWTSFEVGLIVPRQNGKGALLEARQLAGLFLPELREPLAVHSAHEFKTAYEHFLRITSLIENCRDLDRRVLRVRRGAGEQAVELKNGCRLRFLARSTGSGRGLTGDTVYLDEAFALTSAMMGALLPTLSAVPNPQVWYTSSAPRLESEVLHGIRKRGREGLSERLLFAEWGLDHGVALDEVENWYRTNPGLGIRITEEIVRAEWDAMQVMPQEFGRERLGIAETVEWDGQIPVGQWDMLLDAGSEPSGTVHLAVDVSPDRRWSSFGLAGVRKDGLGHVEVRDRRPGTDWLVDRAVELTKGHRCKLLVDPRSPAGSFIAELAKAGVDVDEVVATEYAQACGKLAADVGNSALRHRDDPALRAAIVNARERPLTDAWAWSRVNSEADISPLVAITLAWGRVPVQVARPPRIHVLTKEVPV
jgi:phage terminase large subunit-like protein